MCDGMQLELNLQVQLNVDTCSGTCARRVACEMLLCAELTVRSAPELCGQQLCYTDGGSMWLYHRAGKSCRGHKVVLQYDSLIDKISLNSI